jgi:hypothetical protein
MTQSIPKAHRLDNAVDPRPISCPAGQAKRQDDVVLRAESGNQVVGLEHEPHTVSAQDGQLVVAEAPQIDLADEGMAGREGVEAGTAVQQRRLPRA